MEDVARIVAHMRRRRLRVRILLRANSGFARANLMAWCEETGVDFPFALARNERLVRRCPNFWTVGQDEAIETLMRRTLTHTRTLKLESNGAAGGPVKVGMSKSVSCRPMRCRTRSRT